MKMILAVILIAVLCASFFYKQLKRWVVLQLLLAMMVLIDLIPIFEKYQRYSEAWINQPDDIEYDEIPYITTGFEVEKNLYPDLESAMTQKNKKGTSFLSKFLSQVISPRLSRHQEEKRESGYYARKPLKVPTPN